MKKLLFILFIISLIGCEIEPGFDPCQVRYQAAGLMMDITVHVEWGSGSYQIVHTDWIGEFNYVAEYQEEGIARITITNKDGGNIIGAIYQGGQKLNHVIDPAFVEFTEVIE